ncbi:MAG TPA: DUF1572 domain-containing protein [Candidatus Acidoferrales bacterium]
MPLEFTTSYTKDAADVFRYYKKLGDRAMAQCPDEKLCAELSAESNSIATIVKHLAGNMRSRWTDFLTTDGEKANRKRDTEFEEPPKSRAEISALWEGGWKCVFDALKPLTDADLTKTVTIRTEPHSVMQAINRQIAHYVYHVGQIVYLSRYFAGDKWQTLTVPKKKSEEFNKRVASGELSQR